jgi:hypothetical protein
MSVISRTKRHAAAPDSAAGTFQAWGASGSAALRTGHSNPWPETYAMYSPCSEKSVA